MLTEPIQELIAKVEEAEGVQRARPVGESAFKVNTIISKAATFYEKVRYLIDYREEHTIRRAAIERILKRKIFIENRTEIGSFLLQELIDGQYLPKEAATGEITQEIDAIVAKFLRFREVARASMHDARKLASFAASEIEATLSPLQYAIDASAADAFYKTVQPQVSAAGVSGQELDMQLYCACRRSLSRADNESVAYALWLVYVPHWENEAELDMEQLAPQLPGIIDAIESAVKDPLQWQLAHRLKNETIYFHIVRELFVQKGRAAGNILAHPSQFDDFTKDFLAKKYEIENERIQSSGIRAVVYLFITKVTLAFVIELPYEVFFLDGVNYVPLITNILFHPTLLFLLTRGVGSLDENNTAAIMSGIHAALYEGKVRPLRVPPRYTAISALFGLLYVALLFLVFGTLIGLLELFGFNVVSIGLFVFFLALVSYFAFRIRYNTKRWRVVEDEGALATLGSILAFPIIRTGRWLSRTFSTINIFILIMDFIIETPFKFLLNFSSQFLFYLKEKADEVY